MTRLPGTPIQIFGWFIVLKATRLRAWRILGAKPPMMPTARCPRASTMVERVFYVFGRYPKDPDGDDYPVIDLVLFHGDFLNANHEYVHENKHITGFGSYGDVMIRDRKMYVAPTPFALTDGTAGQRTLIIAQQCRSGRAVGIVWRVSARGNEPPSNRI